VERAIKLGLVERLPKGWATPKPALHPNELEGGAVGTAAPGGPEGSGGSTGGGTSI
jgi:hypothetical protein